MTLERVAVPALNVRVTAIAVREPMIEA